MAFCDGLSAEESKLQRKSGVLVGLVKQQPLWPFGSAAVGRGPTVPPLSK